MSRGGTDPSVCDIECVRGRLMNIIRFFTLLVKGPVLCGCSFKRCLLVKITKRVVHEIIYKIRYGLNVTSCRFAWSNVTFLCPTGKFLVQNFGGLLQVFMTVNIMLEVSSWMIWIKLDEKRHFIAGCINVLQHLAVCSHWTQLVFGIQHFLFELLVESVQVTNFDRKWKWSSPNRVCTWFSLRWKKCNFAFHHCPLLC